MKFFLFGLFFSFFIYCTALTANTNVILKGKIHNCKNLPKKIWLTSFYGTTQLPFDTSLIESNGKFIFKLTLPSSPGYYRLSVSGENYTDIILKPGENPEIEFENCVLKNIKKIKNSKENQILFESKILAIKKKGDPDFFKFLNELAKKNHDTFIGKTTKAYIPLDFIIPDTFANSLLRFEYIKQNYFMYIDFNSDDILHSTLLPNVYMRYFENYTDYNEDGFKQSIDAIMQLAQKNEHIYAFTLDFLINLFKKAGPEIILEYIVENYYYKFSCGSSQNLSEETKRTIDSYGFLMPGKKIPGLKLKFRNDADTASLNTIYSQSKLTLLVFWASFCHFCDAKTEIWNHMSSTFASKGLSIVYISIDTDKKEWEDAIVRKNLQGYQSCDLNGWESKTVKQLNVNRTPYLFLLKDDGSILLKDPSSEQLLTFLVNFFK